MGSAVAQWLTASGAAVVLVDRFARGHTRGGSHGDSRIFRLAYPEHEYAQLAVKSLPMWRDLEEKCGRGLLVRTGGVDHGPGVVRTIGGALARLGVPFEAIHPHAAMERWPGMRFVDEVVFQPDAGRLDADGAVNAFQSLAELSGATPRFGCRAGISEVTDRRVIVATESGEIEARVVIVCAGPWSPLLAPSDLELPPLRVTHEQPAYFPVRRPGDNWPVFVHYDASGGHTFAGYGLEVPGRGVKVGLHASGAVIDPDQVQRPMSREVAAELARYVASWLPGLEPSPTETVSCIYDSTPHGDFVIDRRGRVVVACGFSGHGFKFAPAIGQLVAKLALGEVRAPIRFRFR